MSFFQCITASFSGETMLFAITPTWLKPTSLLKEHGFSQKQSIQLTKRILQTDVKYRIVMKHCHFSNDKLLGFQKKHFICNLTNLA